VAPTTPIADITTPTPHPALAGVTEIPFEAPLLSAISLTAAYALVGIAVRRLATTHDHHALDQFGTALARWGWIPLVALLVSLGIGQTIRSIELMAIVAVFHHLEPIAVAAVAIAPLLLAAIQSFLIPEPTTAD
jgi:hypothetical protein